MQRHPADPHAALDLFRAQLPEPDLQALAQIGTEFRCPARWPLLVEATPAHDLYLIGEGTADVYRRKRKLARVGPGEVVGECALWSTGLRSATVSAVTALHGIRVPYDRMPELLDRSDRLASMILTRALERACADAPSHPVDSTTEPGRH